MRSILESLKEYFENTPKEVLENDWSEMKYLNDIGPDAIAYAQFMREQLKQAALCLNFGDGMDTQGYEVSVDLQDKGVAADALYCLAAL